MISCTEFIPAYSELFSYLDETYGREEVDRFWDYLFEPTGTGIPLIRFVKEEGIRGCYTYWAGTLNEEAADFTMYLNEKAGWFMIDMHRCPSKGRLLQLKDELDLIPYRDYCLHCDHYRAAIEQVGLCYQYNFVGTGHAACTLMITDPTIFDGRFVVDDDTLVMERKATDNDYFHRDFHSSMNMGIHYLGERFGQEAVEMYLTRYTMHVYRPVIEKICLMGLSAIEETLRETYEKEKAADALVLTRTSDSLTVHVRYCPAVRHLRQTGRIVSPWYRYTTETVMRILAEKAGAVFSMIQYDEETGAACYTFTMD